MKYLIFLIMMLMALYGCNENNTSGKGEMAYTCPMPEDSVFSDKPGKCPKCGMELIAIEQKQYTCPMPQDSVFSDKPGKCPKCGMKLVLTENNDPGKEAMAIDALLKPTDEFAVASIPVITTRSDKKEVSVDAYGEIDYDTRQIGNISARVSGRIERLYVRYKYQKVTKGQKVMDIYSPELMAGQENLLFLIKNDPSNEVMIQAAKQKLLLLGMTSLQLHTIIARGKPDYAVTIYSNFTGHIHEGGAAPAMSESAGSMGNKDRCPASPDGK